MKKQSSFAAGLLLICAGLAAFAVADPAETALSTLAEGFFAPTRRGQGLEAYLDGDKAGRRNLYQKLGLKRDDSVK